MSFFVRPTAPPYMSAKFEKTGSVNNQPTARHQRNSRSVENVANVRESVQRARGSQFLAVYKNSAFRKLQLGEFFV
ncbi:hypothetical protein J6590_038165 [Homalodisca vitripennis]|nr:hypothetical protein J6590_038165 [Homalodisca vitripennis]